MSSDTSLLPGERTADFCIDPADLNVPKPAARQPSAQRISILPAIDLVDGSIGFALPGGWASYFHPEPWRIESALRQAVRPAQWNPYLEVLTITVAGEHSRADAVHFSLSPGSPAPPAG